MMVGATHVSSTLAGCSIPANDDCFPLIITGKGCIFTGVGTARVSWDTRLHHKKYLCLGRRAAAITRGDSWRQWQHPTLMSLGNINGSRLASSTEAVAPMVWWMLQCVSHRCGATWSKGSPPPMVVVMV